MRIALVIRFVTCATVGRLVRMLYIVLHEIRATKAVLELYLIIDVMVVDRRERLCIRTTLFNQAVTLEIPTYVHKTHHNCLMPWTVVYLSIETICTLYLGNDDPPSTSIKESVANEHLNIGQIA